MRTPSRYLWLLVAVVLFATGSRLYRIQAQSIWFDEGWSAFAAAQPTIAAAINADPTNPPLYYLLLNLSVRGIGDSVFSLRVVSALTGLLAIPLSYRLGRRLFGARAGLYAAFLVAVSPLMWWAAQEARMYSLLAVLTLTAALAWHCILDGGARGAWPALWLSELGLLYAHNTGPVAVLWLNAVTLLVWLARRSPRQPDWRVWAGGQLAVGMLWLPWLLTRFVEVAADNRAVASPPQPGGALFSRMWQAFWTGPWAMVGEETWLVALSAAAFVVTLAVLARAPRKSGWLVAHVALILTGLLAGLSIIGNEMHGRYEVMATPLLLVALGAGMARPRHRHLSLPVRGFFLLIFISSVYLAQDPAYAHDDARAMAQYYAGQLTADDTVLAWSYADRYELAYYWERLDVQARRVTLPEGAELDAILPLLPRDGAVAVNIWYTQRADLRGMLPCILGHGTVEPPASFTVYGMANRLYRASTLQTPQLRPVDVLFGSGRTPRARVMQVGRFPVFHAAQGMCLPVELTLLARLDNDLKAALVAYNHLGAEIARADAIFADAAQRTTSQREAGATLTAYPLLRLPYGAPPGDYRVVLRVYDEGKQPSGYDVLSPGGAPSGKDAPIGTWRVLPGADWAATTRSTELSTVLDLPVSADLTLLAHGENGDQPARVVNGTIRNLTLLWSGRGALPDLWLRAADGSWRVPVVAENTQPRDTVALDWRTMPVPLDAAAGLAELTLPNGTVLARYAVDVLPAQYTQPEVAVPFNGQIPGVGTLSGFTLPDEPLSRDNILTVTLVWRADATPETSYTVFVQLLDADGRLIAQSDALPADGARPTTGWRSGEYIEDTHHLAFNADAAAGTATLIAGMYDAATGERVPLAPDGATFLTLTTGLTVR